MFHAEQDMEKRGQILEDAIKQRKKLIIYPLSSFHFLLSHYANSSADVVHRARNKKKARWVFDYVVKYCRRTDTPLFANTFYHVMINSHLHNNEPLEAEEIYFSCPNPTPGLTVNIMSYYATKGNIERTLFFFDKLNHDADIMAYNIIIRAYCAANRYQEALGRVQYMIDTKNPPPNTSSFNHLLSYLTHQQANIEETEKILEMMKQNNILLDKYTISTLFNTYSKINNVQRAHDIAQENNLPLPGNAIVTLIKYYYVRNEMDEAKRWIKTAIERIHTDAELRNATMRTNIWLPLIYNLAARLSREAYLLLDAIYQNDIDILRFTQLMRATKNDLETTKFIFDHMQKRDVPVEPNYQAYKALLTALANDAGPSSLEAAEQLYKEMREKNIVSENETPFIVQSIFINMYEKAGDGYQRKVEYWQNK
jgi:pentatricopeptide repeat protein